MYLNDKKNLIFAIAMSVLSIFLTANSFSYAYDSSVLLRGLSILLAILSLSYLAKTIIKNKEKDIEKTKEKSTAPAAFLVFSLIVFCIIAIPLTGFFVSFLLFIYLTQVLIAKRHKNIYAIYSLLLSLFIYIVFFGFLGVSLPESLLPIDQLLKLF